MKKLLMSLCLPLALACSSESAGTDDSDKETTEQDVVKPDAGTAADSQKDRQEVSTDSDAGQPPGDTDSDAGMPPAPAADAGTGSPYACTVPDEACDQCVVDACEDEYCGCADEAECRPLVECLEACADGDADCNQACYTAHESGISASIQVSACAADNCANDCGRTQAWGRCEVCAAESCRVPLNDCVADPDCSGIITCLLEDCQDGIFACLDQCGVNDSAKATRLFACVQTDCGVGTCL